MTDDEDDWFERALRDLGEESSEEAGTAFEDPDDREGEAASPSGETETVDDELSDDEPADGSRGDTSDDSEADRADSADGGNFGEADPFGGRSDDGSNPFDAPSADADGVGEVSTDRSASDAPFGRGDVDSSGGEDADAFTDEGDDPFGGGTFGDEGGDPFGGSVSPDDADPTGFDEAAAEAFDSDIDRTDIGISGLDEMILGGVPSRSLLSVIGGAGTGKTTFALQFLNEALESGNRGVYITLEQSRESILATAEEKGWSFREHASAGRLAVVALDPIEMANSLASIRNDLSRLIESFGADRLVLDSVSLLEMMYDHPAKRRSEVFGFTRSLKEAGVTTLLTSEASEETAYASRYGIVEYLTDAVFVLQYVRGSDFRETRLAVEIQKIRDANHSRETKPYEITNSGISVYRQANIF